MKQALEDMSGTVRDDLRKYGIRTRAKVTSALELIQRIHRAQLVR